MSPRAIGQKSLAMGVDIIAVCDHNSAENVGAAMGRFHMSWATSSIIGPSVGGFLAIYFPSYRPVFLVAGLLTGTSMILPLAVQ